MTDSDTHLERIARELTTIRKLVAEAVHHLRSAESEIPEKTRRFVTYMHDIHDIMLMYQQVGHDPPAHVKYEGLRCDDRFRQLLEELHTDGGAFEKVRREMAKDEKNRWDHTRLLTQEKKDEARTSE